MRSGHANEGSTLKDAGVNDGSTSCGASGDFTITARKQPLEKRRKIRKTFSSVSNKNGTRNGSRVSIYRKYSS